MNIGRAIYNILKNDTAVSSMVSTRISPNVMSQTSAFPFIVYDVTSDMPEGQKDSVALLDTATVMVSAYCKTYKDSNKLSNYIRTALDRVNGMNSGVDIQAINFDGYDDIFDDTSGDDGIYRKSLNFQIRILNSFNNIYSMDFDGVDDYVALGISGIGALQDTGTISSWVKLETVSSTAYIMRIFGDADNHITLLYHNGSSELRGTYKSDGSTKTASTTDAIENDGLWHHVLTTWDSSGNIKIYLDGVLKDTNTFASSVFASPVTAAAIGSSTEASNYWQGNLDEISIYNYELSAANVTTLYNDGLPYTVAADTGLIGWWRMGDGTLTGDPIATFPTIPDETGNNDGTMTNMTSTDFEADVPE